MLLIAIAPGFLKLGLIMLILGGILMGVVTSLRKLLKKNKKVFFIYTIILVLLFAGIAWLSNDRVLLNSPLGNLISFQILFLILGFVHVWVLRKFFKGIHEKPTDFWPEFLYTLVSTIFGLVGFIMVAQLFKIEYTILFTAAALFFVLPFMMVKVYEYSISVPIPVYESWDFPLDENIKDPTSKELKNPRVISFEFSKEIDVKEITNFKLKAPEEMELGKLFYFFVNDYNERHPEDQISYINDQNEASKWIFYSKPNFLGSRKYFNYRKTVHANSIQENDTIVCQRV